MRHRPIAALPIFSVAFALAKATHFLPFRRERASCVHREGILWASLAILAAMFRLSVTDSSPMEARSGFLPQRERAPRRAELTHGSAVWCDRRRASRRSNNLAARPDDAQPYRPQRSPTLAMRLDWRCLPAYAESDSGVPFQARARFLWCCEFCTHPVCRRCRDEHQTTSSPAATSTVPSSMPLDALRWLTYAPVLAIATARHGRHQ